MDPERCKNDAQRRYLRNIEEFGVSIVSVAPRAGDEGLFWTYSIGLWQQYQHPEVIIVGLEHSVCSRIINDINAAIRDGLQRFEDGTSTPALLKGDYICYFQTIEPANHGDFLLANGWFYADESFPAVQLIWPDMDEPTHGMSTPTQASSIVSLCCAQYRN